MTPETSNMFPSSSFSSQELPWRRQLRSRRLLSHQLPPFYSPSPPPFNHPIPTIQQNPSSAEPSGQPANNRFDANVVMVLSVLLCALICSLGLNSIIRCALRCSTFVAQTSDPSSRSAQESDTTSTISTTACSRLANTGIRKQALKAFTTLTYSPDMKLSDGLGSECVICLAEFAPGDKLRFLPKCNHGFHARCIDRWLNSHSSCPTCRNSLIDMPCQKIVSDCNQDPSSSASQQLPPPLTPQAQALPQGSAVVVDTVMPLQAEDLAPDHLQGFS